MQANNAITPAYVRTPMVSEQLTAEQRESVVNKIPVRRYCEAAININLQNNLWELEVSASAMG